MDAESQRIYDRFHLHELLTLYPDWEDTALAAALGRTKEWVQEWRPRVLDESVTNFSKYMSRSRAPKTRHRQVHPDIEQVILELREELSEHYHRPAGPVTILQGLEERYDLKDEGYYLPTSTATIYAILCKHGYIARKRKRFRIPIVLPAPNEEWEMDFGLVKLSDGTWFEFFIVVDRGTSRVVYLEGKERYNAETALEAVARLFILCGRPQRLRMDRDTRFVGAWTSDAYPSALLRFIRNIEVEPIICPPRRPDLKPFVERTIYTIKHEWFRRKPMNDIAEARDALETFPHYYHAQRRHQGRACGGKTPDQAFPSLPVLPTLPDVIASNRWLLHEHGRIYRRRVNRNGTIQIDKHIYYLGTQYAKRQILVHLDAEKRVFHFQDGQQRFESQAIQGIPDDEQVDFQVYLFQMKGEARSAERQRFLRWHRVGEAA